MEPFDSLDDLDQLKYYETTKKINQIVTRQNVWENAYFKYQTGLLTEDQYRAWHEALSGYVKCCMHEWLWEEMRDGQYRSDFVAMIDAILADKQ